MTFPAEVWLRGPIKGIQPLLQPAAHALLQVGEDVGGGSLDRLLTYSRAGSLSAGQLATLAAERTVLTLTRGVQA